MKAKLVLFTIVFVLIATLVAAGCSQAQPPATSPAVSPAPTGPAIQLSYATYFKEDYLPSLIDKWFMDEVSKRTNNRVTWKTYFAGTLLGAADLLPGASRKQADVVLTPAHSYNPDLIPLTTVAGLIYLTNNTEAYGRAIQALYDEMPEIQAQWNKNGVRMLYVTPAGVGVIGTKKPVTTAADMKGLKIRSTLPTQGLISALATPVSMNFVEIYDALSKGVLDGYTGAPFDTAVSYKLQEVAPYILDSGMGNFGMWYIVINLEAWNSLPDDIKKVFDEVAKQVPNLVADYYMQLEEKGLQEVINAKATMSRLSKEEMAKWKEVTLPAWDAWVKEIEAKGLPAQKALDTFKRLVPQYEAQSKYRNPWDVWEAKYKGK